MDLPASRDFSEPAEQNKSIINQSHTHTHSAAEVVMGGCKGCQYLGLIVQSRQYGAVWAVMEGSGPLLLSCLSLLISCFFYHSLLHKTNNAEHVCFWSQLLLSSPLSSSFFLSPFSLMLGLFFFSLCPFFLWVSPGAALLAFFSFLFTFFLLLDDFPLNGRTCSHSASCCSIL